MGENASNAERAVATPANTSAPRPSSAVWITALAAVLVPAVGALVIGIIAARKFIRPPAIEPILCTLKMDARLETRLCATVASDMFVAARYDQTWAEAFPAVSSGKASAVPSPDPRNA